MKKAWLTISGPQEPRRILLAPQGATLGRSSNCDVILDHEGVSRLHARIYQDPFGRWIIEDLNSHNGVFIGEHRVRTQAVTFGENIHIAPFTLSLSEEANGQTTASGSKQSGIPLVDKGTEETVVSYSSEQTAPMSPALVQQLNEFTGCMLDVARPAGLYSQACICLAELFDAVVVIVRLPIDAEPLQGPPDVLACHFTGGPSDLNALQGPYLHLSKRVLTAVRSTFAPVMASSKPSPEQSMTLTVIDEHSPHLVFAARVNDMGETTDVLYIDIPQEKSPEAMFDFVEAVARQINFIQKNLFLTELEKQEKALRQANIELKEKDRIKDEYVSRVTHDIKGHLAAIQSCLYAAQGKADGSTRDQRSGFLSRAIHRTGQLSTFVRELLALTEMRLSGNLQMETFYLPKVISKVLSAVETRAREKSITVSCDVEPSVGDIVGNEFSINEMLTNLLFNAVKYTPENGSVEIRAASEEDAVCLEIRDTGIGVPKDELEHVFDEFFRASNAKKRERDGTGLGLSIVRQIIQRHGGHIFAESQVGVGTTFKVILPINDSASGGLTA